MNTIPDSGDLNKLKIGSDISGPAASGNKYSILIFNPQF